MFPRLGAIAILWPTLTLPALGAEPVDYLRDVKPILEQRCTKCHGTTKHRGMLRLDTASLIKEGGESGSAIVAGKPDESLLFQAIAGKIEGWRMPPPPEDGGGEPLSAEQIDAIRRWIEADAAAPDEPQPTAPPPHWAYVSPKKHAPPEVKETEWAGNPIDAFIAARHTELGLKPNAVADRATLLRRVYLDLIGLPPTPAQLEAFIADTSDGAYEKVVDELLASKHYGERWGRHWMDIWRYSDWYGWQAEIRNSQRHLWRWRDWIVESLNSDKGYDRMVAEMLAGDEIAPADPVTLRATGYLARNWFKFNRNVWLDNTVEHTAKAFLGTTMNCARCHEHKYDPITHRDYYRFRAFFEPYEVRTLRVPGQTNTEADGLSGVYDSKPDEPTYRFLRGNEKQPDKARALGPGVPKALSLGEMKIEPVALPPEAYYPGLKEFVRKEAMTAAESELAASEQAITTAKATLDAANQQLAELKAKKVEVAAQANADPNAKPAAPPPAGLEEREKAAKEADGSLRVAFARKASAQTQLLSARARILADDVVYGRTAGEAETLKLIAASAERQAALRKAEYDLAAAEQELAVAQGAAKPQPPAINAAKTKADAAKAAIETARANLGKPDGDYPPLSPVYPKTSTGRRTALAGFITDRRNPLTARVAVNHIWLRHFGEPLVGTVFDFGANGAKPTHPELLDTLAATFMDEGWSMKKLHKLIVTSRAYRMSSGPGTAELSNAAIDPDNKYLWRQNVRRAEAEVVRDSVLAAAGKLDETMGGPDLDQNTAMATHRRSLYYRTAPEKQSRFFMVFDAPSPTECYRRDESVVPQQALAMVNSTLTLEQARTLSAALTWDVGAAPSASNESEFIQAAFTRLLCRAPTQAEADECRGFLKDQAALLADAKALTAFAGQAAATVKPADLPHLRARENLVQVLMNHNDFVTIR